MDFMTFLVNKSNCDVEQAVFDGICAFFEASRIWDSTSQYSHDWMYIVKLAIWQRFGSDLDLGHFEPFFTEFSSLAEIK